MGDAHDEKVDAAAAEVRRLDDVLSKLEAERAALSERDEQVVNEPFDTPEQEAEIDGKLEIIEQEEVRIGEKIAEAEDEYRRAQENFDELVMGADEDDDADGDTGERLDVHAAAEIWRSNGMDEDYMFGYTEDELRRAAEEE
jgi:chromosome segregation ATPase